MAARSEDRAALGKPESGGRLELADFIEFRGIHHGVVNGFDRSVTGDHTTEVRPTAEVQG